MNKVTCTEYKDLFGSFKEWVLEDSNLLHREDGPALIWHDGTKEYYLMGKHYSFDEWDKLRKLIPFM